jgi:hypothetical protein
MVFKKLEQLYPFNHQRVPAVVLETRKEEVSSADFKPPDIA